jgi:hypothetical protein
MNLKIINYTEYNSACEGKKIDSFHKTGISSTKFVIDCNWSEPSHLYADTKTLNLVNKINFRLYSHLHLDAKNSYINHDEEMVTF